MSSKVVKLVAVPAVLGIASIRVYTMRDVNTGPFITPQELSVYSTLAQTPCQYVQEQPGVLQTGLGKVRQTLQSGLSNIKHALLSVKITAVNLYHGGEDIYHFLKDPPTGFVPRVTLITVSGLAGVILARKGSRLKRVGLPLSLATAGFAMCYPVQTIAMLKVSGKNIYTATRWTSSTVASLWKSEKPASEPSTLKTEDARIEETSADVHPPSEPSSNSMPEAQTTLHSASIVCQDDGTEHTVPSAELLTEAADEQPSSPSYSASAESVIAALPEEVKTAADIPEQRDHSADSTLKDFGQSNPEDADLYSTRS